MGSPANKKVYMKYVGNGSATAREFSLGFKAQFLQIMSVVGEVCWAEGMPGAWKQVDSAVPVYLASAAVSGLESDTALGFQIASTDTSVNGNGTVYHVIAE